LIGYFLVGDISIAITIDIQFDRLEFDDFCVGDIVDVDGGKIGIARKRTLTGKFW
jgi:hypothetical protein